jgi:hypothetical protein
MGNEWQTIPAAAETDTNVNVYDLVVVRRGVVGLASSRATFARRDVTGRNRTRPALVGEWIDSGIALHGRRR